MSSIRKSFLAIFLVVIAIAVTLFFRGKNTPPVPPATATVFFTPLPTLTPPHTPSPIPIDDDPLKELVIAAGDYLVRQQLANGELSYQVDFMTGARAYSPSTIRLMAGTGSLFTVCRVAGDEKYCSAGDAALGHYLTSLVTDPQRFKGTCLYTDGSCQLSGAAMTVDAIYRRWQASSNFSLNEKNLLNIGIDLGYFIVSMRRPEGGFYQSFDPHFSGTADTNYFAAFSQSEALLALTELYEMTGNDFWLTQAREVNAYLITQPVTEDYWHGYALSMLARLDKLSEADQEYAVEIADTIIVGQVRSLDAKNTSISTATKGEALSTIAQALYLSGADHAWLDPQIRAFITFVQARQLPDNNCNWDINEEMVLEYGGGLISSCDDASIRIDGVQHWINGVTAFLEYRGMINVK